MALSEKSRLTHFASAFFYVTMAVIVRVGIEQRAHRRRGVSYVTHTTMHTSIP